jgi:L-ribulose-5-phosphate 3-epimerase
MTILAVMQGRLVPPVGDRLQAFPASAWRDEFRAAQAAGVEGIEWIYEAGGEAENPLSSDEGIAAIRAVVAETGVIVSSVCADWFMAHPLQHGDDGSRLQWLLERTAAVGGRHVVVPFVDDSALAGDEIVAAADQLRSAVTAAERFGVEIHLETSLDPCAFSHFLDIVDSPFVRITYDIGNSASLGFDPRQELAAFGDRIGSVHVKDRRLGGGTVPLGQGAASLPTVFAGLRRLGYDGTLVLQVARGQTGSEPEWVSRHRELVQRAWEDAA